MHKSFLTLVVSISLSASAFAGEVKGKVTFKGTAPKATKIQMNADPNCVAANKGGAMTEQAVVGADGSLANVFVYLKDAPKGVAPKEGVSIAQDGCKFTPRVLGVMVNQPLTIVNNDSTLHNVHALPKGNAQFNMGMPIKGMKMNKTFANPEIGVRIKCDVHPWMAAWVNVVENPYFAVSGKDGSFTIKNVPDGTFKVGFWHEVFGTVEQTVTVKGGAASVSAEFK